MSIWQENLGEFRDRLASPSPAPGGGAGAMVGAVLGAGLLIMAAEIAFAREGASPSLKKSVAELRDILDRLSAHADEDIAVYESYVYARKLPRGTEEEKEIRSAALMEALSRAADAPAAAIKDALLALAVAEELAVIVPPGVLSDIGAGAALLFGGVQASLFTLDSNIRLMKDPAKKHEFSSHRADFANRAEKLWQKTKNETAKRLV